MPSVQSCASAPHGVRIVALRRAAPTAPGIKGPWWMVALYVAGWYAVGISIVFGNKHVLTDRRFEYPFFLAFTNNVLVFAWSVLLTWLSGTRPPALPWATIGRVVIPIGVLTALDIGCSNKALVLLPVAFHTILRGTIPAFVLAFGLVLRIEKPSLLVAAAIIMVCTGAALAAWSEVECDPLGLLLVLLSCAFSGLRWALTQILVSDPAGKDATAVLDRRSSPLLSIYYVSPACAAASLLGTLLLERRVLRRPEFHHRVLGAQLAAYVAVVSVLVFCLLYCEFGLVRLSSSLSLSVFGVLKELLTILAAAATRGDIVTPTNLGGFLLCAVGILTYHASLARKGGEAQGGAGADADADVSDTGGLTTAAEHDSPISKESPLLGTANGGVGAEARGGIEACGAVECDDDGSSAAGVQPETEMQSLILRS